jgi:hypothetical protein
VQQFTAQTIQAAMRLGPLNLQLESRRFHNNEKVEITVRERLRMQKSDLYRDGIFYFVPERHKCAGIHGDRPEKQC